MMSNSAGRIMSSKHLLEQTLFKDSELCQLISLSLNFGVEVHQSVSNLSLLMRVGESKGVSETLCMRLSPCRFDGSSVEPFWV
jgi:hypothetical protein